MFRLCHTVPALIAESLNRVGSGCRRARLAQGGKRCRDWRTSTAASASFGLQTTTASKGDPNRLAPAQGASLSDAAAFKRGVQRTFGSVTVPTVPGVAIESIADPDSPPGGVVAILVPSSEAKPHRTAGHLKAE
jgi:hypothetical protein